MLIDSTPSSIYDGEFEPLVDDSTRDMLNRIGDDADDTAVYSKNNNTMSDNDSDDSELEALLPTNNNLMETEDVYDEDEEINPLLTQSAEYKRKHFNATSSDSNDSSSSTDDDSITRGLDFQILNNNPEPAPESSIVSSLIVNCKNTLASTIIDGINQQRQKQMVASRSMESSDSDSEFEILDDKDLVHYKP